MNKMSAIKYFYVITSDEDKNSMLIRAFVDGNYRPTLAIEACYGKMSYLLGGHVPTKFDKSDFFDPGFLISVGDALAFYKGTLGMKISKCDDVESIDDKSDLGEVAGLFLDREAAVSHAARICRSTLLPAWKTEVCQHSVQAAVALRYNPWFVIDDRLDCLPLPLVFLYQ